MLMLMSYCALGSVTVLQAICHCVLGQTDCRRHNEKRPPDLQHKSKGRSVIPCSIFFEATNTRE